MKSTLCRLPPYLFFSRLNFFFFFGPSRSSLFCSHLFLHICVLSSSVVSDSLQPRGQQHARPLCPCDSPGKAIFLKDTHSWSGLPFFFRGSSQPRDWTWVSYIAGRFFTNWATIKAQEYLYDLGNSTQLDTFHSHYTGNLIHCFLVVTLWVFPIFVFNLTSFSLGKITHLFSLDSQCIFC